MSVITTAVSTDCQAAPGEFAPVIDRGRCEAKGECVEVCPYQVFELRPVGDAERRGLGPLGRLKLWVHGGRQAYAVRAADCRACGRCVKACPEKAIRLRRSGGGR